MNWRDEKVLVTGGSGFLGGAILRRLAELGCREIRSFNRSALSGDDHPGVETMRGDLCDLLAVRRACADRSMVFHVAAKAEIWGPPRQFFASNVAGTRQLLAVAREAGVGALVYTSSPSVAYDPCQNAAGMTEAAPPPARFLSPYQASKAQAEAEALAASGPGFPVVALRPHLIWGPGDRHLLPRVLDSARRGRLMLVGEGRNRVDLTFVENAVAAQVLAAENLRTSQTAAGQAYFISDGAPVVLWEWIGELLRELGLPPVRRKLSFPWAYRIGACLEVLCRLVPGQPEPPMTRFLAGQLAHDHWFDLAAVRRDLGYAPVVDPDEAKSRTLAWLRENHQWQDRR